MGCQLLGVALAEWLWQLTEAFCHAPFFCMSLQIVFVHLLEPGTSSVGVGPSDELLSHSSYLM